MNPQNKRDEICAEVVKGMNDIDGEAYDAARKGWDACEREIQETTWTANPPRERELTQRIARLESALKRFCICEIHKQECAESLPCFACDALYPEDEALEQKGVSELATVKCNLCEEFYKPNAVHECVAKRQQ